MSDAPATCTLLTRRIRTLGHGWRPLFRRSDAALMERALAALDTTITELGEARRECQWEKDRASAAEAALRDATAARCSFCGKSQHEVRKLIAGPTVFICDECVGICTEIVEGSA